MGTTVMKICIATQMVAILGQLYLRRNLTDINSNSCQDKEWQIPPCRIPRKPLLYMPTRDDGKPIYNAPLIKRVFDRLSYEIIMRTKIDEHAIVDIVWSYFYPFGDNTGSPGTESYSWKIRRVMAKLAKHHPPLKVNHFPGIGVLTSKAYFNVFGESRYVPKTFAMPEQKGEFLQHTRKSDTKMWIQKNKKHRGNQVKEIKDLDLDKQVIIQQFIHNQFLLYGHVINIGIHVIITSAVPLRVYILDSAWLMRICSEPYDLNDFSDLRTYVTDGEHMDSSLFKFPPMKRYFNELNYSRKQALQAHTSTELGFNPDQIDRQLKMAIEDALIANQEMLSVFVHDKKKTTGKGLYDSDIFIENSICYTATCQDCKNQQCRLCSKCLSEEDVNMLKVSYAEHINRQGLRRAHPPPMTQKDAQLYDDTKDSNRTKSDQINMAWFRQKCIQDSAWCT